MPGRRTAPRLTREEAAWSERALLIGVDEVGRGPLAGPVVAAAVVFPPGADPVPGVRDSKTLTPATAGGPRAPDPRHGARGRVWRGLGPGDRPTQHPPRHRAGHAPGPDPRHHVLRLRAGARRRARRRGIESSSTGCPCPSADFPTRRWWTATRSATRSPRPGSSPRRSATGSCAALRLRYPSYGWESNAGYGTAQHCEAITLHGPTPHHRRSFAPVSQFTLSLSE